MHPTQVGPYAIERKIGAGGMGTVYLGRHRETGRLAAVKVLPPSLAREDGFVARFTREIDAMKRLANPHVVELFESGVDHETYYYSMEYVEGETLTSRLIRDKRMPWREAVEITLQICVALKAAHDAGIVHRDLKPSNLLLATNGTVKLTDFGVAQVFAGGKLTVTGGIIGTAEYMSPEQAAGARATKKSDLYSLGAVLYAMLTGRPPFTGKTTLEVIQKHRHAQFDRPSRYVADIPHWLDELVIQLLEKEPDKRPPDAFVLSRRLQEILRKVDLSSGAAETLAGQPTESGTNAEISVGHDGPGVATLMRDLVQHEVREAQKLSPVARFFDNLWVLSALLILTIGGGVLWFKSRGLPPAQKYAAGVVLLEQPEGPGWIRARDEYLLPLVESDPATWKEEVRPHLDRIAVYEWKSGIGRRRRRNEPEPASEAQRVLRLAQRLDEAGDRPRAERTLEALVALLKEDPQQSETYRMADDLLTRLRADRADASSELSAPALKRAVALAEEGKTAEATKLLDALQELYGEDPLTAGLIRATRDAMKAKEAPPGSAGSP